MADTIERIATHLNGLPTPVRILELGCGRGELFKRLNSSYDIEYYTIEPNEHCYHFCLAAFDHLPNFHIQHAQYYDQAPYKALPTFDFIVSRRTFDRLEKFDIGTTIEYISHFLKPRGKLIVQTSIFKYRWLARKLKASIEYSPLCVLLTTEHVSGRVPLI